MGPLVDVTADVHYASATHYRPENAHFTDFEPFWEFVGGPIMSYQRIAPALITNDFTNFLDLHTLRLAQKRPKRIPTDVAADQDRGVNAEFSNNLAWPA